MKKILILGGTYFQIPAIKYAKRRGYYVITCDYLPENPGHKYADEYFNVSTTDQDGVLDIAAKLQIDGILCFASDPAAPTAAYVSEKLNLPGNPLTKIELLGEKHLWRKFLSDNGFNTPKAKSYASVDELLKDNWIPPVMLKPVDSSGSKGVTKVTDVNQFTEAFDYALTYSRSKRVIVEEFVERVGPQIGGDGFFGDSKLDFVCFGDQVVNPEINPFVPCGMKFPSGISLSLSQRISNEIEKAIQLSGLKYLSFNLEVMVDKSDNIYLMELGPRNGGNCIPEVINYYTNVDMVGLAVEAAMGNVLNIVENKNPGAYAYYALHSAKDCIYNGYSIENDFKGVVLDSYIFKSKGDAVSSFNGSNATIGVLLLKFACNEDLITFFEAPSSYIKIY